MNPRKYPPRNTIIKLLKIKDKISWEQLEKNDRLRKREKPGPHHLRRNPCQLNGCSLPSWPHWSYDEMPREMKKTQIPPRRWLFPHFPLRLPLVIYSAEARPHNHRAFWEMQSYFQTPGQGRQGKTGLGDREGMNLRVLICNIHRRDVWILLPTFQVNDE